MTWTGHGLQRTFQWLANEADRDLTFVRERLAGRDGYDVLYDKKLVLSRLYRELALSDAATSPVKLLKHLAWLAEQPAPELPARQRERFSSFWGREVERLRTDVVESMVRHLGATA